MQFKKQKDKIQVLAYRGYDAEKKRAIVKMLGSIDAYSYRTSDGLYDDMTVDEKSEVQSYIETLRQSKENESAIRCAEFIERWAGSATQAIADKLYVPTEEYLARVDAATKALKKEIRKALKSDKKVTDSQSSEMTDCKHKNDLQSH